MPPSERFDVPESDLSDAELLEGIQANSEKYWQLFWKKYQPKVRHYFAVRLENDHVADDLTQEVFLRLVRNVGRLHDHNIPGLIVTIQRRILFTYQRGHQHSSTAHIEDFRSPEGDELPDDLFAASQEEVGARLQFEDLKQKVDLVILGLPLQQREAMILALEGHEGKDIAQLLQRSHGTVRNLLTKARASLRDQLKSVA